MVPGELPAELEDRLQSSAEVLRRMKPADGECGNDGARGLT